MKLQQYERPSARNITVLATMTAALLFMACSDMEDAGESRPGVNTGDENFYYSDADIDGDADGEYNLTDDSVESSERYEAVGTNPFVYTAHDPFSTFAADVDSASYDIFKRDVNRGLLPDPDSVRLEEYVNYFSYDYPVPARDDPHPFTVSLAAAPGVFNPDTRLLRVGLQAYRIPDDEKRPVNLVFLIDTSGSMSSSDKLPLVQSILTRTLDILAPTDTISIVTYAGSTRVALEPTPISDKSRITDAIDSFSAAGSTAGGAGIQLAYEQAEAAFIENGINHVILCTDGDFNVGMSDTASLTELIVEKRETGTTLTVLGFGSGNLNDGMMESISNAGNGTYAVITSAAHAEEYVENTMISSLFFVAKDLKIQVEFNPENVLAYRLLGYENRAIADDDFRIDAIDAGEVGSGHQVTALYELVMVGGVVPLPDGAPEPADGAPVPGLREVEAEDIALVKIRYKHPDATAKDEATELGVSLAADNVADMLTEADDDLRWAAAVAAFAEILKNSPYANPENLSDIETIVTAGDWLDARRAEFTKLFTAACKLR